MLARGTGGCRWGRDGGLCLVYLSAGLKGSKQILSVSFLHTAVALHLLLVVSLDCVLHCLFSCMKVAAAGLFAGEQ